MGTRVFNEEVQTVLQGRGAQKSSRVAAGDGGCGVNVKLALRAAESVSDGQQADSDAELTQQT